MELEPIQIEVKINKPVSGTWKSWVEADELKTWLAEEANVSAVAGGPYELFWEPQHPGRNSTQGCKVLLAEPGKKLAFTWKGPEQYAELMNSASVVTSVTVTFEPKSPDCTVVRLVHSGWQRGEQWAEAREWHEEAWLAALDRLRKQEQ